MTTHPGHRIAAGGLSLFAGELYQLPLAHFQQPVGLVEVVVVVANHHQRLAQCSQLGRQLTVKDPAELGVLVGGPSRLAAIGRAVQRPPAASPGVCAGPGRG